ncbi:hypothetical protein [Microbacterium sp. NPDC058389]|uniref:hypothetical protein n=1 Tax=Microbacterium sp. NPDC058389 TaxID=3346475 RepID=UPI00364BEA99
MPHPPVPQRFFVDADVLATPTPFCWLAMLRDETDGAFQLHTSPDELTAATLEWRTSHQAADASTAARREHLLRAVLDEVTGATESDVHLAPASHAGAGGPDEHWTPDEFLCLVDDESGPSVRALTRRRQDDVERRRAAGLPTDSLTDALVAAGCPAFAERVSAHLRALAA